MELGRLREVAEERSARWAGAGIVWEIVHGPLRDKPASWLVLNANAALGQLTVWASGEAQMDWGSPSDGGVRHYNLASVDDLRRCVDDLEAALIGCR